MKKQLLTLAALTLAALCAQAVTPLWLRDVQISPDGSRIAFCYKGDIFTVPATGGTAERLTTQDSYEATPYTDYDPAHPDDPATFHWDESTFFEIDKPDGN